MRVLVTVALLLTGAADARVLRRAGSLLHKTTPCARPLVTPALTLSFPLRSFVHAHSCMGGLLEFCIKGARPSPSRGR